MNLTLNATHAKAADDISAAITESGKYIGTITRAEKLVSERTGTVGLGLSFRADNGLHADYLDLYHTKGDGTALSALKTVNAILCCTRTQQATEGTIGIEKWSKAAGKREKVTVPGYPALMGKKIGFLLRKTLETGQDGKDRDRMEIFAVFDPASELTASEMYARQQNPALQPEKLTRMLDVLTAKPINDKRKRRGGDGNGHNAGDTGGGYFDGDPGAAGDDVPF